ncbi:MAG: HAMP domain-containing sensor histidine kinase [Chitinophagaceae bacterium]
MRFFTIVFTLLLLYTVAALIFWGFSLQKQSRIIYDTERAALHQKLDSVAQPEQYRRELTELDEHLQSRHKQYFGEGSVLLLILFIGSVIVYGSLQRNVRLQRQQRNFMLAVTHELKSPIAGMKLSLQTLQKRQLSEEQKNHLLNRCIQESDRLSDLCNNMLITSQIEGRQYKSTHEKFSLSEMVEDTADLYLARYPNRITTDIQAGCTMEGDRMLLQMALTNLLENAIKYTPDATPIEIRLKKGTRDLTLEVADNGHGIPDKEKRKVLTKFYRVGDEATRKTKGTGLGLFLTAKIVKQHKGKFTVLNNEPQGALFRISLPC